MTFLIDFLGCKVNSYEVECIGDLLIKNGYTEWVKKPFQKEPDVVIINTCAVTETSTAKDRKMIRQYRRQYKKAILIVMGCYSQYDYDLISEELNADIVLGTANREKIIEYIEQFKKDKKPIIDHVKNNDIKKYEELNLFSSLLTTRVYLKIQDGCDNYCTYCLIPYIRGRSRSRSKPEILKEVKILIASGYKEIILTGIDMSSYGEDLYKDYGLSDLIEDILKDNPDLYRLRISSLEASKIDDKFIKLLEKYPNFANHLHIPLQSASINVLKKMNRQYDINGFKDKIAKIRKVRPDISITTDVIVGFPTELDDDFNDTFQFCKKIKFSKIHVFPYSSREGTIASKYVSDISDFDKKVRVTKLIALSDELELSYSKKFNGKTMEFLLEKYDEKKRTYHCHSSNHLEYFYKSDQANLTGKIISIKYDSNTTFFDIVKK
jgi:threonylcarbamoyladenosine tRNA methylthiotransferase MtaB